MNEALLFTKVVKRDGRTVDFDLSKVISAISKAAAVAKLDKNFDVSLVANEVVSALVKKFTDANPPSVEQISDCVETTLMEKNHVDIAKAYILYRQKRTEERKAKEAMIGGLPVLNKKITVNALKVLKERYLLKDEVGKIIETPDQLFWRVANNIAEGERRFNPAVVQSYAQKFYDIMANLDFLPNTPTLMNAGTRLQQLSACFVLPIEDSMEGIFTSLLHAALIHKSGGGTGFSFSRLRPKNSVVQSTKGVASGPVSFLKAYNAATEVIKQGGKRRGANMGILRVDHPDVLEFISCKEKNDDVVNFNISVAITNEFLDAVEKNTDYDLKDPRNGTVVSKLSARMVFDMLVSAAWRNGDPGVVFIDRIDGDNPTPGVGKLESTNPCGEQPLLPYEACNLGSINLGNFVTADGNIDWVRLKSVIHTAIRFLDNVVEMSNFPISEITRMVRANRKIGLGVMGWADLLVQLGWPYDSDEGVKKAEEIMSFIKTEADNASEQLAKERGPFPNWFESIYNKESKHFKGVHRLLRNATRTTIAPTGTLSMIADCSGGVEPIFALSYVKRVMDGKELFYMDKNFRKALESRGLYDEMLVEKVVNQGSIKNIAEIPADLKKVFVVSHDISPEYHVKMQAAFQKFTDNAVSKTVNFSHSATADDVRNVYLLANKLGCKGITIYRDGSKENQVLNLNINIKKEKPADAKPLPQVKSSKCPHCSSEMEMAEGCCKCHSCGYSACSV